MPSELISRLDTWMKSNRKKFYANLKPGAPPEKIDAFEKELGHTLPETLRALLLWRNGERDGGPSERFIDNYSLMSIEEIASAWRTTKKLKDAGEFDDEHAWHNEWVPFVANGGGDHLCVGLAGIGDDEEEREAGQVIEYWHADSDRTVKFASIDVLFEKLLYALEHGEWSIEDDGFFAWDEHEEEDQEEEGDE